MADEGDTVDEKKGHHCVKLLSERCLYYIDEEAIRRNVKERGFLKDPSLAEITHSDLTPGVYEGGFKVWECCIDLCEHIENVLEAEVLNGKKILENAAVIDCFTKDNFAVNNVSMNNCRFYACDWATLQQKLDGEKFDVILTAETIYNEDHYAILHDLFESTLPPDGLVLLAAKQYYFGVGGNLPAFLNYVKTRGVFDSFIRWDSESEIPRRIVQFTRKSCS